MMYYEALFHALNRARVKYVVVGGVAVNLRGYIRMTNDVDLLLAMTESNLKRFVRVISRLGYYPRVPVPVKAFLDEHKRTGWIRKKHMKVFSFNHPKQPFEVIDVMISSPVTYERARRHAQRIAAGSLKVPTASIDDLIRMKQRTGRPRDRNDIAALREVKRLQSG